MARPACRREDPSPPLSTRVDVPCLRVWEGRGLPAPPLSMPHPPAHRYKVGVKGGGFTGGGGPSPDTQRKNNDDGQTDGQTGLYLQSSASRNGGRVGRGEQVTVSGPGRAQGHRKDTEALAAPSPGPARPEDRLAEASPHPPPPVAPPGLPRSQPGPQPIVPWRTRPAPHLRCPQAACLEIREPPG